MVVAVAVAMEVAGEVVAEVMAAVEVAAMVAEVAAVTGEAVAQEAAMAAVVAATVATVVEVQVLGVARAVATGQTMVPTTRPTTKRIMRRITKPTTMWASPTVWGMARMMVQITMSGTTMEVIGLDTPAACARPLRAGAGAQIDNRATRLSSACGSVARRLLTTSSPIAIRRVRTILRDSPSSCAVCTWL